MILFMKYSSLNLLLLNSNVIVVGIITNIIITAIVISSSKYNIIVLPLQRKREQTCSAL